MTIHIANSETFLHDSIGFNGECKICGRESTLRLGWIGVHCDNCNMTDTSECLPDLVRRQREDLLKISRRELSLKNSIPYSENQIKGFENRYCPKEYYNRLLNYIKTINVKG